MTGKTLGIANQYSESGLYSYRYGFQSQEQDDEIKGIGNSINYKYRMYDPRIGRFFAIDPLTHKFPYYSPYHFSSNSPIIAVELEGLESSVQLNYNEGSILIERNKHNQFEVTRSQLLNIPSGAYHDDYNNYSSRQLDINKDAPHIDVWCKDCDNPAAGPRGTGNYVTINLPTIKAVRSIDVEKEVTETITVEEESTVTARRSTAPLPLFQNGAPANVAANTLSNLVGVRVNSANQAGTPTSINLTVQAGGQLTDQLVANIRSTYGLPVNVSVDPGLPSNASAVVNYNVTNTITTTHEETVTKKVIEKELITVDPVIINE